MAPLLLNYKNKNKTLSGILGNLVVLVYFLKVGLYLY